MSDESAGSDRPPRHVCPGYAWSGCVDLDCDRRPFPEHQLTEREKELREYLHALGADQWWMVVKGGFRRSYVLGVEDARRESTKIELPSGGGGAPAAEAGTLVEDEDGAPYPEHVQAALDRPVPDLP